MLSHGDILRIAGRFPQVYLKPGDTVIVLLPHSEVCMHMKIAGKLARVRLIEDTDTLRPMAQILEWNINPGNEACYWEFTAPVLPGEAGIHQSEAGAFYCYGLKIDEKGQKDWKIPTETTVGTGED